MVDLAGIYTATQYQQKTIDGKVSPPLFCCYIQRKEGGFWSKMFRVDEGVSMGWWYERNEEGRGELNPKDNYYQVDWIVNSCVTKDLYRSDNTTDSLPQKSELTTNPNWVEIN